jgi:hypothetical protein
MKTASKRGAMPAKGSKGKHGGNRDGDRTRRARQTKRPSQAAGKDPGRGR